jgi:antitoxin YefM
MPFSASYTKVRANFAKLCDRVSSTREPLVIHRRNAEDVALISIDELESLMETAHVLRSSKNARRLLSALDRARNKKGKPETIAKLRRDMGLL